MMTNGYLHQSVDPVVVLFAAFDGPPRRLAEQQASARRVAISQAAWICCACHSTVAV